MTTEAHTRKTLIDEHLRLAGWNLADPTQVVEEHEIDLIAAGVVPMIVAEPGLDHYGEQYADYVLLHRGPIVAGVGGGIIGSVPLVAKIQAGVGTDGSVLGRSP